MSPSLLTFGIRDDQILKRRCEDYVLIYFVIYKHRWLDLIELRLTETVAKCRYERARLPKVTQRVHRRYKSKYEGTYYGGSHMAEVVAQRVHERILVVDEDHARLR